MKLNHRQFDYLANCLQGFFFGIYSGIFSIYLQLHASRNGPDKGSNILFYGLCVLYTLCGACIIISVSLCALGIFRCWIVWRHNLCVVIIPSLLAFSFLIIWVASCVPPGESLVHGQVLILNLSDTLGVTALAISMIVNAVVTGLIVFRICKVFGEVKSLKTGVDDRALGVTDGRSTLRRVIFVFIESGTALFFFQLIRLVLLLTDGHAATNAYHIIASLHIMLNGITPTIILVRVSMGLSFHNENSFVEASIGSFRIPPDADIMPEAGSIGIVDRETREKRDDDFGIQLSDESNIQMDHDEPTGIDHRDKLAH